MKFDMLFLESLEVHLALEVGNGNNDIMMPTCC